MKHFLIQKSNSQVLVEAAIDEYEREPTVLESDLYYNVTANRLTSALTALNQHTRGMKVVAYYVASNGVISEEPYSDSFMRWAGLGYPALPYKEDRLLIKEVPL